MLSIFITNDFGTWTSRSVGLRKQVFLDQLSLCSGETENLIILQYYGWSICAPHTQRGLKARGSGLGGVGDFKPHPLLVPPTPGSRWVKGQRLEEDGDLYAGSL